MARSPKVLVLSPSDDGLIHYGGRAWRDDGNFGRKYMVKGTLMWHVQTLRHDGSLEYGNLLLPAGPLHPHIRAHHTTNHHAQHLQKKKTHKTVTSTAPRALDSTHYRVTLQIVAPANTQVPEEIESQPERADAAEQYDQFQDRHARGIMRAQGVIDVAAGSLGFYATAGAVAMMLAPETLGLSVVLGIAALATYEIFRNGTQVLAGMAELTASSTENDKDLLETREKIDHLKTYTSIAGLATMATVRAAGYGSSDAWKYGLMASDGEAIVTGIVMPDPFEEIFPLARLAKAANATKGDKILYNTYKAADALDHVDKVHSLVGDDLHVISTINAHFNRKKARNAKPQPAENKK